MLGLLADEPQAETSAAVLTSAAQNAHARASRFNVRVLGDVGNPVDNGVDIRGGDRFDRLTLNRSADPVAERSNRLGILSGRCIMRRSYNEPPANKVIRPAAVKPGAGGERTVQPGISTKLPDTSLWPLMKDTRYPRKLRDRKSHLSPDAERLVSGALGLSNSGSRMEDRFWESQISVRLERLLDSSHPQAIYDALDRLQQADQEAYGALVEAVEEAAEALTIEVDGQEWDCLLVCAPLVVWTRFKIPSGPVPAAAIARVAEAWRGQVLADGARLAVAPCLYSIDQLPPDFSELRRMVRKFAQAAVAGQTPKLDLKSLPETADMLADARFIVGVVAVPAGSAIFRWQAIDSSNHANRVGCLEQWIAHGRAHLEPLLPGCGFECLLPDAYHLNLRESDRRVRPYAIQASVHFLTHAVNRKAGELKATVGGFGVERADEYRIGLSVGDDDEVAQGIVWPLLGAEHEADDPSPVSQIRDLLKQAGVESIEIWSDLSEPEYCDDCGAPLFPNGKGEIVHAEMPQDTQPEATHFH